MFLGFFYELASKVTHCHFHHVLWMHRQAMIQGGGVLQKDMKTGSEGHWEPSWRLATSEIGLSFSFLNPTLFG